MHEGDFVNQGHCLVNLPTAEHRVHERVLALEYLGTCTSRSYKK
jgi:hypothetical protein